MPTKTELRAKAKSLEPIIRIGKNGLTESVMEEIKRQLEKKMLIKIKLPKEALQNMDRKEFAEVLAAKTNSEVIEAVGFVIVLHKKENYI